MSLDYWAMDVDNMYMRSLAAGWQKQGKTQNKNNDVKRNKNRCYLPKLCKSLVSTIILSCPLRRAGFSYADFGDSLVLSKRCSFDTSGKKSLCSMHTSGHVNGTSPFSLLYKLLVDIPNALAIAFCLIPR